jgi:hypothetical protein
MRRRLPGQYQIRPPRNSNADPYRRNEQQHHDQSDQKAAHGRNQIPREVHDGVDAIINR